MKPFFLLKMYPGNIFVFFLICFFNAGCRAFGDKLEKQPNVIIIYTDDQAQWTVGAYGNEEVHTPNMDRLASEGMLFTQGVTKPVCSPSRAMLLTGNYSHRVDIPDFIPRSSRYYAENGLPAGTPTIASMLKKAGYATGIVGKWHLGYGEEYYPELYGFDYAQGYRYLAPGKAGRVTLDKIPYLMNGKELSPELIHDSLHADMLAGMAIDFIRTNREKPFFLYFATFLPHGPWDAVTEEDRAHYKGRPLTVPELPPSYGVSKKTVEGKTLQYYTAVSCVDRNIGKVFDVLEELNLAENTIVIFIWDNGYMIGQHGLDGKGNAIVMYANEQGEISPRNKRRPNMFDNSVLVPFIIRWPDVIEPGTRNDALVSTIDILPTLAEITGTDTGDMKIDGRSLLPLLRGKTDSNWRTAYCDTYDMIYLGNDGEKPHMRMIRTDDWKLILYHDENGQPLDNGTRHELFNLKADPGELNNLYYEKSAEDIREKLEAQLRQWMQENELK
ncbi:MAG: sulfatase-like hydrolase/transferase [Deltaproteobacteria bacterium]|nr:sulfatase-like hydrolase/transferase [Deltaproteobacteria bacterium]